MKTMLTYFALALTLSAFALGGCTMTFNSNVDLPTFVPTPQLINLPTESTAYDPIVSITPTSGQIGVTVADDQPNILSGDQFQGVDTPQPIVEISPASGEAGTLIQVVASKFPPNSAVLVSIGPINSESVQVMQGMTDSNGVFIAHVIAQGAPGMILVVGVATADGQSGAWSLTQFQIIGVVPTSQPTYLPPTPTPYLDMWTTYANMVFAVAFEYPADWQPDLGYGDSGGALRYGGINGYFHISAMDTESIDLAVAAEAGHILQPYGSQPTIESLQIQGQEARLILPSISQNTEVQYQAAIIVRYPQPVNITGHPCRFFILWADPPHIRVIAQTIQFIQ